MMKTKVDIDSPALGCKVGRAYQIMLGQLDRALQGAGLDLTTSEYLVLRAVFSQPGAQQCDIADLVGKDKAAVCRCVACLEKKGMLITQSVSHKCLRVFPSDLAIELEPRIMEVAAMRHRALSELTSPEELEIFTGVLEKIINTR